MSIVDAMVDSEIDFQTQLSSLVSTTCKLTYSHTIIYRV